MPSEPSPNPFFKPPRESTLGDEAVRSYIRAQFYDVRSTFLDRLACANVFDRDRFEALLLWLDTLQRSCTASGSPMLPSDFDQFDSIANYLEQQATYSRDQKTECAATHAQWLSIMRQYQR